VGESAQIACALSLDLCRYLPSCCQGMLSGLDLRALCISLEILNVLSVQGQRLVPLKHVGPAAAYKESVHIHPKTRMFRAPENHVNTDIYFCLGKPFSYQCGTPWSVECGASQAFYQRKLKYRASETGASKRRRAEICPKCTRSNQVTTAEITKKPRSIT